MCLEPASPSSTHLDGRGPGILGLLPAQALFPGTGWRQHSFAGSQTEIQAWQAVLKPGDVSTHELISWEGACWWCFQLRNPNEAFGLRIPALPWPQAGEGSIHQPDEKQSCLITQSRPCAGLLSFLGLEKREKRGVFSFLLDRHCAWQSKRTTS